MAVRIVGESSAAGGQFDAPAVDLVGVAVAEDLVLRFGCWRARQVMAARHLLPGNEHAALVFATRDEVRR